ncbi:hypothetical protein BI335_08270 [Enemella evansiae]|uniref:fasciclin domain-containing protein n=1 Tax=Enemella evansiae TaxID=2016499 RepID=UPI000B968985|nr:fasciclin domain-containing protein [Enemella evansiae]OYO18218.1 hypothetical protein BI335_08270 [Enemella evansiae]
MSKHLRSISRTALIRRAAVAGGALTLTVGLAACSGGMSGSSSTPAAGGGASSQPAASSAPASTASSASSSAASSASASASGGGAATAAFGSACSAVPKDGKGSFDGMSKDPVATAASNNPVLSTLVSAVGQAGLVDTLNNAKDITVFAPTNDAFKAMDQATLQKAMGDKKLLTDVLTMHVVQGKLAPNQLAGEHQTLNTGQKVKVTGSGTNFKVNDKATVVCGNVQTANATVYIIDQVLLPS